MNEMLLYLAAGILAIWGTAHLVYTRQVVSGFGPISRDNGRVLAMEWINEGAALLFIAALLAAVALTDATSDAAQAVLWVTVVMLNAMSAVSLFTGFRVDFIAYRLCPLIFTGASLLIVVALRAGG
jgi:hypothetical protein